MASCTNMGKLQRAVTLILRCESKFRFQETSSYDPFCMLISIICRECFPRVSNISLLYIKFFFFTQCVISVEKGGQRQGCQLSQKDLPYAEKCACNMHGACCMHIGQTCWCMFTCMHVTGMLLMLDHLPLALFQTQLSSLYQEKISILSINTVIYVNR